MSQKVQTLETMPLERLRFLAESGDAKAQYMLGCRCDPNYCGEATKDGVQEGNTESFLWYCKAAAQGLPSAMLAVGLCYEIGLGVEVDPSEATRCIERAAETGHDEAQYLVAIAYWNGNGVPQNPKLAVKWMEKAASHGNEFYQQYLKEMRKRAGSGCAGLIIALIGVSTTFFLFGLLRALQ